MNVIAIEVAPLRERRGDVTLLAGFFLGQIGRRYGITGYPETFIIDREGRQLARFIGPRDWRDPAIARDLKTLIDTGKWVRGPDGN